MPTPTIEQLLESVQALAAEVTLLRNQQAGQPVRIDEPDMTEMDDQHLLIHVRQVGGARVDPVVPEGTPYTVTLPATGHTLSVARPDLGEMFVGYCQRVSDQAGGDPKTVGALFLGTARYFAPFGGFKSDGSNWPQAADKFYNMRAYMTDAERAKDDAAKASWEAVYDRMGRGEGRQKQPETPSTPSMPSTPPGNVPADETQL